MWNHLKENALVKAGLQAYEVGKGTPICTKEMKDNRVYHSKEKLDALKVIRDINNYNYVIEVDGGVNIDTKEYCNSADILVLGSYITASDDYINRFNLMK